MEHGVKLRVAMVAGMLAFAGFASAFADAGEGAVAELDLTAARSAAKDLGEALKTRLGEALKAGGPVSGLAVCNSEAQMLTKDRSKALGSDVRRTALKVRNPNNAPTDRERKVLEEFAARAASGADAAKLEHAEIVQSDGKRTLFYMKAIPMASEPCAACHGTSLKPDVAAEIARLYPKDQATGFSPGELRGAFVVTKNLN